MAIGAEVPFDFEFVQVVRRMEEEPARTRPFLLVCVGCVDMHCKQAVTFAGVKLQMCRTCRFCTAGGLGCCNLSGGLQCRPRRKNFGTEH